MTQATCPTYPAADLPLLLEQVKERWPRYHLTDEIIRQVGLAAMMHGRRKNRGSRQNPRKTRSAQR